jgi:hypothetical protein
VEGRGEGLREGEGSSQKVGRVETERSVGEYGEVLFKQVGIVMSVSELVSQWGDGVRAALLDSD